MGNYAAKQSLNKEYSKIKGAESINDVAVGFGKGWLVFAFLSSLASAFSFYQDFYKSLGVVETIMVVTILAIALEFFKHLSIKGAFSNMNILSKSLISVVAIGLISVSFYTHYKSIKTFQGNLVGDDLKQEIAHQRKLQTVQNGQIDKILDSNTELSKAINNGDGSDDKLSVSSQQSNNQLIKTLSTLAAKNNMTNTNLILRQSESNAKTTASAILVIFIMVEIMALFSILAKIIVIDNTSNSVREFYDVTDRLEELEGTTYQSLGHQKVIQTEAKMVIAQASNNKKHRAEMEHLAKTMGIPVGLTDEEMIRAIREKYSFLQESPSAYEQPKPTAVAPNRAVVPVEDETTKFLEKLKQNEEVDCEFVEDAGENNAQPLDERERALDINLFEEKEQVTIRAKWANGMIGKGELLIHSAAVIAIITEELKIKKSEAVTLNLYVNNELKDKNLITQTSRGWKANVPLFQHETKEIAS